MREDAANRARHSAADRLTQRGIVKVGVKVHQCGVRPGFDQLRGRGFHRRKLQLQPAARGGGPAITAGVVLGSAAQFGEDEAIASRSADPTSTQNPGPTAAAHKGPSLPQPPHPPPPLLPQQQLLLRLRVIATAPAPPRSDAPGVKQPFSALCFGRDVQLHRKRARQDCSGHLAVIDLLARRGA